MEKMQFTYKNSALLQEAFKIDQRKSIQSITMLGHGATVNELKIVHQSESAEATGNREQFVEIQQTARSIPTEAIRTVQTDVPVIQPETIHQTGKQKKST